MSLITFDNSPKKGSLLFKLSYVKRFKCDEWILSGKIKQINFIYINWTMYCIHDDVLKTTKALTHFISLYSTGNVDAYNMSIIGIVHVLNTF